MPKKPKREIWCTNTKGAARILNVTIHSVRNYRVRGELSGFRFGGNTLIPMGDIAKFMGTTQTKVVNLAKAWDLPLWRCKK